MSTRVVDVSPNTVGIGDAVSAASLTLANAAVDDGSRPDGSS